MSRAHEAHWEVQNDTLVLLGPDKSTIIPDSLQIFETEFRGRINLFGFTVTQPSREIKELDFSKFPLRLYCQIRLNDESPDYLLKINVCGKYSDHQVLIERIQTRQANHIIIENMWYPFQRGGLEEIQAIFSERRIDDTGKITLKQFLYVFSCWSILG